MGIDPRGVHQSLVSNVLWNTHSPKLTKVRGKGGFPFLWEQELLEEGIATTVADSSSLFFQRYNESVTALSSCICLEPNHPCGWYYLAIQQWQLFKVLKLWGFTLSGTAEVISRGRAFVMPLTTQHLASQLLSSAAPNSQHTAVWFLLWKWTKKLKKKIK